MMNLQVRLSSYDRDMRLLHHALFDRPRSDRGYIRAGTEIIQIAVAGAENRIVAFLRPSDLYLVGFETSGDRANAQRWFFPGDDGPGAAFAQSGKTLNIVGSYARRDGLAIYYQTGTGAHAAGPERNRGSLEASITTLARYAGGTEEAIKKPLADICFLLPEAFRSMEVFRIMTKVCAGGTGFRYEQFKDDVNNWAARSRPGHPENYRVWTNRGSAV